MPERQAFEPDDMLIPVHAIAIAAQLAASAAANARSDGVDALMQPYAGDVPGASVLVVRDGATVLARAYGLASIEPRIEATTATNYRLASVTKQFTAAAILLLAADGELALEDHARRWLPELPAEVDAVTLRQLLTHTSGIFDYEELVAAETTVPLRDVDVLGLLRGEKRTYFAPGDGYRYSNSGYALLALVVERVSGRSFADFLEARIFRPLGMAGTVAHEHGRSVVAHRAYGHRFDGATWLLDDQSLTSAVLGDGGIYSSIDDLAKWDAALDDERLLPRAALAAAFSPATATDAADVAYGYGWRITGETVWHSGETVGFRNVIVRWPAQRLTVVVLTNRDAPEPYATALVIGGLYLAEAPAPP